MDVKLLYPLSHAQKRIWYNELLFESSPLHNIGGCVGFQGNVNFEVLEEAINETIKSHPALRIRIQPGETEPKQYIKEYLYEKLDFIDFSREKDRIGSHTAWAETIFRIPFTFGDGSLFYFAMYQLDENNTGFLLKLHHIICDGWSVQILIRSIYDYYTRIQHPRGIFEPDSSFRGSYIDYLALEQKYMASKQCEKNKTYWHSLFERLPESLLEYSPGRLSSKRKSYQFDMFTSRALKTYVHDGRVSIPALISAFTAIYMTCFYGKEEIVLGIPVYNRESKTACIIGQFTSNAMIRLKKQENVTVFDYIQYVSAQLRDCYRNQKYPYDLLVKDLELRKRGKESLYQIAVNYYNTSIPGLMDGMKTRNVEYHPGEQFYAMQLVIKDWKDTDSLEISVDYQTERFTDQMVDDFYEYLIQSIYLVMNAPETPVSNVPLLCVSRQRCLLDGFNYTGNHSVHETVIEMYQRQVKKNPDRIAVSCGNERLTYRELDRKVNRFAKRLKKSVRKGAVIGILAEHSVTLIIAIMAVLKIGAAFVPIDRDYPKKRIDYILADTDMALLLTDQPTAYDFRCDTMDINAVADDGEWPVDPPSDCGLHDLAYILYTSGSTGEPKGVMIEHGSLSNYISYAADTYVKHKDDVFACFTSISFDLTMTSIFTPLVSGIELRIYQRNAASHSLARILEENKASVIKLTPAHLALINEHAVKNSALRTFILGGETLSVSMAKRITDIWGRDVFIYNEYGPTEATVGCMTYHLDTKTYTQGEIVPIGVPIRNTRLYVMDEQHRLLPMGAAGELYIAGAGVAKGYLNKAELTNRFFYENPQKKGERIYKTGDIVKLLADGNMLYIGRKGDYLKYKGYRIVPEEIETILMKIAKIKKAVVLHIADDPDEHLHAFLIGEDIKIDNIKQRLSEELPAYMIPQHFTVLKDLPLTINGKIDKTALLKHWDQASEPFAQSTAEPIPQDEFLKIIQRFLNVESLVSSDNYFDNGGDSIKAIQISGALKRVGLTLSVKHILNHPKFCDMYEFISSDQMLAEDDLEDNTAIPMTPIIRQYMDTLFRETGFYNQSVLLKLKKPCDETLIQSCIKKLTDHHGMLRLKYDTESKTIHYGNPYEENSDLLTVWRLPDQTALDRALAQQGGLLKRRIALERGETFKALLITGSDGISYLCLTAHHICVDAVSWRILLDDLNQLLDNHFKSTDLHLPKGQLFYHWAKALTESGRELFSGQKDFWAGMNRLNDFPSVRTARWADVETCAFALSEANTEMIVSIIRKRYNVYVDEFIIITLVSALFDIFVRDEITIQLEGHGREALFEHIDTSRAVGWFTSIYPITLKRSDAESRDRYLLQMKEQLRRVHQGGIGYGILSRLFGEIEAITENAILFNFLGDYDNLFGNEYFEYSAMDTGPDASPNTPFLAYAEINAFIIKRQLHVDMHYHPDIISSERIKDIINRWQALLHDAVTYYGKGEEQFFSPSDFTSVSLSQNELDNLLR